MTRCKYTVDLVRGATDRERERERWGGGAPWSPWAADAVQSEMWPCLVLGDKHGVRGVSEPAGAGASAGSCAVAGASAGRAAVGAAA